MLENSIWKQYNDELNLYGVLMDFYAPWEMELPKDELFLHNTLKAKLTKKEFRLFAMINGGCDAAMIQERFKIDQEELEKAKQKLFKKLKQDKVRLAFLQNFIEEEEI
jgi:DNA-binding CsgD family transcriptional regulator